ncbi:MAG: FAD-dependent oxidoreductase [Alphaproteobacteria bacterium]|nr:FAD-dependent oxidoreductase [Alphaproteobacteria bacterium]
MPNSYDVIVVGAGTAGLPAAIFAAQRGARVLLLEAAKEIGGTLHLTGGQLSAAGTRLQAAKGIVDSPDQHFDDIMRISRGTANAKMVRLAVDNAADTMHWLFDLSYEPNPESPIIFMGHEPYRIARTYMAETKGKEILRAMAPVVNRLAKQGRIDLRLNAEMTGFVAGADGGVDGVVAQGQAFFSTNIVLTTGGYANSPELFPRLTSGYPLFGRAAPFSRGTGIELATKFGAVVRGGEHFVPGFAGVEHPDEPGKYYTFTNTTPQLRPPREIYVGSDGHRFMREDLASVDEREHALLGRNDLTFWAVYDHRIADEAPFFFTAIVGGLSADEVASAFARRHPSFVTAATLAELAARTGLPADALAGTVADYNRAVDTGHDALGRQHLPRRIEQGPFYAVRHGGMSAVSFAGLAVDDMLRVIRADGSPIPHVYAAGETLGFALLNGGSYCSGMSLTPALTFGRLLGQRLLHWRSASDGHRASTA